MNAPFIKSASGITATTLGTLAFVQSAQAAEPFVSVAEPFASATVTLGTEIPDEQLPPATPYGDYALSVAGAGVSLALALTSAVMFRRAFRFGRTAYAAYGEASRHTPTLARLADNGEKAMHFRLKPEKAVEVVDQSEEKCKELLNELAKAKKALNGVITKAESAIALIIADGAEIEEAADIAEMRAVIAKKSAEILALEARREGPLKAWIDNTVPVLRISLQQSVALREKERDEEAAKSEKRRVRRQAVKEVLGFDRVVSRKVEETEVRIDDFLDQVYGIREPVERARVIAELDAQVPLLEKKLSIDVLAMDTMSPQREPVRLIEGSYP